MTSEHYRTWKCEVKVKSAGIAHGDILDILRGHKKQSFLDRRLMRGIYVRHIDTIEASFRTISQENFFCYELIIFSKIFELLISNELLAGITY